MSRPALAGAKRLILYDLDGTLVDTLGDLTAAVHVMLARLGAPPAPASEIRRHVGRGATELVRRCLGTEEPGRVQEGLAMLLTSYEEHLTDSSCLYPGTRELLAWFGGRRQAVITNKPDPHARRLLEALGIAGFFEDIVAGNGRYPKKPDPAAVLGLMGEAGARPAETLMIGDSPIDVDTGRRAGVSTVGVLHGFCDEAELLEAAPDVLVKGFPELRAMAITLGW